VTSGRSPDADDPSDEAWAANAFCPSGHSIEEVTMSRRLRLWIVAVLAIAMTGVLVGVSTAAQAGIVFNSID